LITSHSTGAVGVHSSAVFVRDVAARDSANPPSTADHPSADSPASPNEPSSPAAPVDPQPVAPSAPLSGHDGPAADLPVHDDASTSRLVTAATLDRAAVEHLVVEAPSFSPD
jgi:hypothetical protein